MLGNVEIVGEFYILVVEMFGVDVELLKIAVERL